MFSLVQEQFLFQPPGHDKEQRARKEIRMIFRMNLGKLLENP
jgi:hypothetical protein